LRTQAWQVNVLVRHFEHMIGWHSLALAQMVLQVSAIRPMGPSLACKKEAFRCAFLDAKNAKKLVMRAV
jgi:hypothetical protein